MRTISDKKSVSRHFSLENDLGYSSHENSESGNNHYHHHNFIKVSSPESDRVYTMTRGEYNITKPKTIMNPPPPPYGPLGGPQIIRAEHITVQSDSTRNPAPAPAVRENYWKINFTIVFLPFILIGIPIHAIILDTPLPKSKWKVKSIPRQKERFSYSRVNPPPPEAEAEAEVEVEIEAGLDPEYQVTEFIDKFGKDNNIKENYWFRSLFRGFFSTLLTLLLVPLALVVNAPPIYSFYQLFRNVVVLGEIPPDFIQLSLNFVYWLPFPALVNYTWIFGWQLRNRLAYFKLSGMHDGIFRAIHGNFGGGAGSSSSSSSGGPFKYLNGGTWNSILQSAKGCRVKMCLMYVTITSIHVIHFFIVDFQRRKENWDSRKIWAHWLNYVPTVFLSLMLPAYACFCWAILFQFRLLSGFIDALVIQRRIKTFHRNRNRNHNQSQSQSQHREREDNNNYNSHEYSEKGREDEPLLKREFLALFKQSYRQISDSILQINRHFSIFISVVFVCLTFSMYTEVQDMVSFIIDLIFSDKDERASTPGLIRSFVGELFNLLLYSILAIFTIWQAVQVNDEAREFHVALNDIASESEIHANSHALSLSQNYNQDFQLVQAFRLLKNYVHSRMEQEKPALLTITILFLIPGIRNRLTNYNVRH